MTDPPQKFLHPKYYPARDLRVDIGFQVGMQAVDLIGAE
jgi:hypothetical protein